MAVRWDQAKIEFIPLMPDIKKLAESGYCKKRIFEILRDKKQITMSWWTFNYRYNKHCKCKKNVNTGNKQKQSAPPAVIHSAPALMQRQNHMPQVQQAEDDEEFGKKKFSEEDLF